MKRKMQIIEAEIVSETAAPRRVDPIEAEIDAVAHDVEQIGAARDRIVGRVGRWFSALSKHTGAEHRYIPPRR